MPSPHSLAAPWQHQCTLYMQAARNLVLDILVDQQTEEYGDQCVHPAGRCEEAHDEGLIRHTYLTMNMRMKDSRKPNAERLQW